MFERVIFVLCQHWRLIFFLVFVIYVGSGCKQQQNIEKKNQQIVIYFHSFCVQTFKQWQRMKRERYIIESNKLVATATFFSFFFLLFSSDNFHIYKLSTIIALHLVRKFDFARHAMSKCFIMCSWNFVLSGNVINSIGHRNMKSELLTELNSLVWFKWQINYHKNRKFILFMRWYHIATMLFKRYVESCKHQVSCND